MNLKQLTYFLQIAELQSFTRAANVLHVAQPSLSRQIQLLEHELGVLLFVRSDKGAKMTEAGVALQKPAQLVVQQVRRIKDEVGEKAARPRGELSFGLPQSLFDLLTVPLICEFRARYPEVELFMTEGVSITLHQAVLSGKLDTAVISDAEPLDTLRSAPLLRERLYLVGPKSVSLEADRPVDMASVAERPLLLTSRPNALRMIVEHALASAGHRVKPTIVADSARLLCELAANGLGCTILTFSAFAEAFYDERISIAPIEDLSVTWTQISSTERGMPLAGRKLGELISELADQQIVAGRWLGVTSLA